MRGFISIYLIGSALEGTQTLFAGLNSIKRVAQCTIDAVASISTKVRCFLVSC